MYFRPKAHLSVGYPHFQYSDEHVASAYWLVSTGLDSTGLGSLASFLRHFLNQPKSVRHI